MSRTPGPYRVIFDTREGEFHGTFRVETRDGRVLARGIEQRGDAVQFAATPELLDAAKKLVALSAAFSMREATAEEGDDAFEALTLALRDLGLAVQLAESETLEEAIDASLEFLRGGRR